MADQLLQRAARLYGLSAFSNRPTVLGTCNWGKTEIQNSCEQSVWCKIMEIIKNL